MYFMETGESFENLIRIEFFDVPPSILGFRCNFYDDVTLNIAVAKILLM